MPPVPHDASRVTRVGVTPQHQRHPTRNSVVLPAATFRRMPPPAYSPDEISRILEGLRQIVEREGSQRRAARATGIAQQHISRLLRRPRHPSDRPGPDVARAVARYLGITESELTTGEPPEVGPRFRDLPDWVAARREAQARMPALRDEWLDAVGELRHPRPPPLTADLLASFAMTWATSLPPDHSSAPSRAGAAEREGAEPDQNLLP